MLQRDTSLLFELYPFNWVTVKSRCCKTALVCSVSCMFYELHRTVETRWQQKGFGLLHELFPINCVTLKSQWPQRDTLNELYPLNWVTYCCTEYVDGIGYWSQKPSNVWDQHRKIVCFCHCDPLIIYWVCSCFLDKDEQWDDWAQWGFQACICRLLLI